ncbi:MAG: chemotaxis response regulator protein-glutamate methylesterase [Gammaproteobacteria bacterium]|nr:MAG: chemotaxis response regulator protein-glutamate methylesterase [Gammaproteobacteria bacterium]
MTTPIKVMIIDDSALVRKVMSDIVNSDPQMEVVAHAQDPIFAQRKLETIQPDVIILDIEMPRMDGITFLQQLMPINPIPVVICSSFTEGQAQLTMQALKNGAVDVINKPKIGLKDFLTEASIQVREAIKAAAFAKVKKPAGGAIAKPAIPPKATSEQKTAASTNSVSPKYTADAVISNTTRLPQIDTDKIIAIGASTGGTQALRDVLADMPHNSPATLIVQHMPEQFTAAFAQNLNEISSMTVSEACGGEILKPGQAWVAPGNKHMLIKRIGKEYEIELVEGQLVNRHRPAVDVLFRSVSRCAGKNAIGCLLTGMGDDGARGLKEMRDAGARTFSQDEETSVVYGMPKEAWLMGASEKQVSLQNVATILIESSK